MVTIGEKTRQTREAGLRSRSKPVVQELVRLGRLKIGDRVTVIKAPISGEHLNIRVPTDQKVAVFIGGNRFKWEFDGSSQTLTSICREIFKAQTGLEKPFAGPSYFAFEGESESLSSVYDGLMNPQITEVEETETPVEETG